MRTYKGKVYRTHLLRRSYREGGKVKHQTLGNLSHLPPDLIETIRRRLRGETAEAGEWEIVRSLPHGHVAAVLGTLCKNRVRLSSDASTEFYLLTQPTAAQQRALELLGVAVPT